MNVKWITLGHVYLFWVYIFLKNVIVLYLYVLSFLLRVSGVVLKPNFVAQRAESGR